MIDNGNSQKWVWHLTEVAMYGSYSYPASS